MIKRVGLLLIVALSAFAGQVYAQTYTFPVIFAVQNGLSADFGPIASGKQYRYCTANAGRGVGDLFMCGSDVCAKLSNNGSDATTFCIVNYRTCSNAMNSGQGFGTPFRCFNEAERGNGLQDGPEKWCGKTWDNLDAANQNNIFFNCVSQNQNIQTRPVGTPATPSGAATDTTAVGTFGFDKLENPLAGAGVTSLSGAIGKVLGLILRIAIPFVTLMLIYTGFLFVRAQGDPGKLKEAKNTFVSVIIGAALLMGCAIIANTIANTIEKVGKAAGSSSSSTTTVVNQPSGK